MTTSGTHKLPDYLVPVLHSETESTGNPPSGKGLYYIPAGHSWDDCWELAYDMHIEADTTPDDGSVVVTCVDLQEYGIGDSLEFAITDLLTSLSDYYQSLESREAKLGPSSVEDLEALKRLLRFPSDGARGR